MSGNRSKHVLAWLGTLYMVSGSSPSEASAPQIYRQDALQSPVRGSPDDLLLVAGYGFSAADRIVYRVLSDRSRPATPPVGIPRESNADLGVMTPVSTDGVPYALTVKLPQVLREAIPYELWTVTAAGEWSDAVRINDARPLWITPAFAYAGASLANLPRHVRIVGRNLDPAGQAATQIRLSGPRDLVLYAAADPRPSSAVAQYVAEASLPERLLPGSYHVQVKRDATGWVDLPGQIFEVRPDPPPQREFSVGDPAFGGCMPDDGRDDAACLEKAIAAASASGGGTVVFGPGEWDLSERAARSDGIVVPLAVNLRGAGRRLTTLVQRAETSPSQAATLTLLGHNVVEGLRFRDERLYGPEFHVSAFIKLGLTFREGQPPTTAAPVDDVVITGNSFDKPYVAISDGGLAMNRVFITYNDFNAYNRAIDLGGNRFLVNERFGLTDSVIAHNAFKPGSYIDVAARQGAMASELGASTRVDFSRNVADGAATDALNSIDDARGWRGGFFWHLNDNVEMLLVADNTASCTGDKAGDGEAIAFDNNANTFALPRAEVVTGSTEDSVTLAGPLIHRQNDRDIHVADYYRGHWVQVGDGPGLGQARKIRGYTEDAASGNVTFWVSPAWDVIPAAGKSRVSIGREYWQVYTLGNTIDHRKPPCEKSNRTGPRGGGISLWAQAVDSVIEGNLQFDTDGIVFQQYYDEDEASCRDCIRGTSYMSFLQIRGNIIIGEYAWDDECSSSGIFGSLAAGPTRGAPPTVGFGLSISHNVIERADGLGGGAISLVPTWYQGPPPHRWPLVVDALIHHNEMIGLDGPPARPCRGGPVHERTGISVSGSALARHSVLYANVCAGARLAVVPGDAGVTRVCPARGTVM